MLPIKLLHDRVLVSAESDGERHSSGGILILRPPLWVSGSPGRRSWRPARTCAT